MRALLDVSVLIALFDSEHVHHEVAAQWLADHRQDGWATCPLTQNGCIRILSQPKYSNQTSVAVMVDLLGEAIADPQHAFWPDSFSLLEPDALHWDNLLTGRHLTDVYLLALAYRNNGRLVTLDQGIPFSAVPDARAEHLVVLSNKTH